MIDSWIANGAHDVGYSTSYVNGVKELLKSRLLVERFDNNTNLVPFQNGVLNLKTGELHEHSPEYHITWCLPYDYNPRAQCTEVITWLYETVGRDNLQVQLIRAFLKAILTGRADFQRFLHLVGPGGSGKGTLMRLAEALVGTRNTHSTTLKRLETNRFETSHLYNARLCVITDSERYAGEIQTLKAMTGQDLLPNERKHQNQGEPFRYRGMVIMASNEELSTADLTSGMQRRRITVRFDNVVKEDQRRNLEEEFQPLLPGVVAWVLRMNDERMRQFIVETTRYVPNLGSVAIETLTATNSIAAWMDSCVVPDSLAETPIGRLEMVNRSKATDYEGTRETVTEYRNADVWLYPSYCKHCSETGNKPVSSKRFTELLIDLTRNQLKLPGVEHLPKKSSKLSRFKGIRVRTDADTSIGFLAEWAMMQGKGAKDSSKYSYLDSKTKNKDSKGQQGDSKRTAIWEYRDSKDSKNKLFPHDDVTSEKHADFAVADYGSGSSSEKGVNHIAYMGRNSQSAVLLSCCPKVVQVIDYKEVQKKSCRPDAVFLPSTTDSTLSFVDSTSPTAKEDLLDFDDTFAPATARFTEEF